MKTDLTGRSVGRLTILTPIKEGWICQCSCGQKTTAGHKALLSENKRSCGCLHRESSRRNGKSTTLHGMKNTRPYRIWFGLRNRCNNTNNPDYPNYGGRGITYDTRWDSFEFFWSEMSPDYSPALQIDRIDNNGPYTRENCKWSTPKQQQRNRGSNRRIATPFGLLTLVEVSEIYGIPQACLSMRRHWPAHRMLEPKRPHVRKK